MKKVFSSTLLALFSLVASVSAAFAITPQDTSGQPTPTQFEPLHSQSSNISSLGDLFGILKGFLFSIIGIVVAGLILYAGFLYMTSAGEPEKMKKAQSIFLYTFIGVAIIILSVIIVRVVAGILGVDISFLF